MSFHTITATKKLSSQEFFYIKDRIYTIAKKKNARIFSPNKKEMNKIGFPCEMPIKLDFIKRTDILSSKGILIDLVHYSEFNHTQITNQYHGIMVKINPTRLLRKNDFISLTTASDVEKFFIKINNEFKKIAFNIPDFELFSLKRIDYSSNILLEDQSLVNEYMQLIYRCRIPKRFKLKEYNNKNGFKVAQDTIAIAAYNKNAQMIDQAKYFKNLECPTNILRFEIQTEYLKIYNLKKECNIVGIKDFLKKSDVLARKLFYHYVKYLLLEGDYYKLEVARELIMKSEFKPTIKERMVGLLERTSSLRNLDKAIKEMKNENQLNDNQIKRCIENFNKIGLNPVTIPRRWKHDVLRNPLKLITVE